MYRNFTNTCIVGLMKWNNIIPKIKCFKTNLRILKLNKERVAAVTNSTGCTMDIPGCHRRSNYQTSCHSVDRRRGTKWCLSCMCSWICPEARTGNCRCFWPPRWFDTSHQNPRQHYSRRTCVRHDMINEYDCTLLYSS